MTPPRPAVSVVIPTYNRADMIGRAVQSVLDQTFLDFEILVIDDASTDGTESLVRSFQDPRIVYVRLDENGGNAVARNAGVRRARGRYISFLDSDDEFLPGCLEAVTVNLGGSPPDIGFTWVGRNVVRQSASGPIQITEPARIPPAVDDDYLSFLMQFRGGTSHGLTVKRNCFEEVGYFDESLRAAVDTDFVLRLVQHYSYVEIDQPLVRYHVHDGERVSRNSREKAIAYDGLLEKHRTALENHRHLWVQYHHKTARLFYDAGERSRARRYSLDALKRHPLHLKTWTLLLLNETLGRRGHEIYRALAMRSKPAEHSGAGIYPTVAGGSAPIVES
jgi:glycosyltransferase involved in cell wall biosynthesis